MLVVLRFFPSWTHPLVSRLLPFYWLVWWYIRQAKSLLAPAFHALLSQSQSNPETSMFSSKEDDTDSILVSLATAAKDADRSPERLAQLMLVLALASIHTTLIRIVSVLYDLVAQPHLLDELRAEIETVTSSLGLKEGWNQIAYTKLHKLDSVLVESQRRHPPAVLGVRRVFSESHTFSNGLFVPKGAYVCLPTFEIGNDPALVDNPEEFDGLRSYRLKSQILNDGQGPTSKEGHDFVTIDRFNLGFGYGKGACPGRFFASLMIKVVLVKLLTEYDFRCLPGRGRPRIIAFHEFLFPPPWEPMLVRRKANGHCPF